LPLLVSGRRNLKERMRSNADGFGVRITAQAGNVVTGLEHTILNAGLSQHRPQLLLGLGPFAQADVVRLRWLDDVWQAELSLPACQVADIQETDRLGVSCPLLFAWNGERYGFVNDFLGAGPNGGPFPNGRHPPPRPGATPKNENPPARPT